MCVSVCVCVKSIKEDETDSVGIIKQVCVCVHLWVGK